MDDRSQVVYAVEPPDQLIFSLDGRAILTVTRSGELIKGPGYETTGMIFADLQRCLYESLRSLNERADHAEAELVRLTKNFMN